MGKSAKYFLGGAIALLTAGVISIQAARMGLFEKPPAVEYLTESEAAERPFYALLDTNEQAAYTALYRGISNRCEEILFPKRISFDTYDKIYTIMLYEESSLFYMSYNYSFNIFTNRAKCEYTVNNDEKYETMEAEIKEATGRILSGISEQSDDFEKAQYIHDYIIDNCTYADEGTDEQSNIYGCLVEGTAICGGYARAFDYLAKLSGMQSVVVTGTDKDGNLHAWNQVQIDGEWYNLDATWDDVDGDGIRYENFLCPDSDFGEGHFPDTEYFEGFTCEAEKANYYIRNDMLVANMEDAERILQREISAGSDSVEIKLTDDATYEEFKEKYITEEQRMFVILSEYDRNVGNIVLMERKESLIMKINFAE